MRQTVAAIDFGTSKIVCVIAQKRAGAAYHVLGSGTVPYAGYSDGRWNDIKKLEDATYAAIREAELSAKRKVRQIYVGVPGDFTRAVCGRAKVDVMSKDRRVSKQDVLKLMRRAEQPLRTQHYKILHRRPVYFTLDTRERMVNPIGARTSTLAGNISCILADSLFLRQTHALMEYLGLEIAAHVSTMVGMLTSMIPREEKDVGCVLVDAGFATSTVSLVQGDGIVYQETIPYGACEIVTDLMGGLNINYEEADAIKRRYAFGLDNEGQMQLMSFVDRTDRVKKYSVESVSEVIEARVEEVIDQIMEVIERSGYRLAARSMVYLAGGGLATMRGIRQFASALLNRNVQVITPQAPGVNNPVYASVLGLIDYACYPDALQQSTGLFSFLQR